MSASKRSSPDPTPPDLDSLVAGLIAGDREDTQRLVELLTPKVYGLLWNHFGGGIIVQELQDIVQEAWLDAFRGRHRYDPARGRFDTWVCRIALSRAIDHRRRAERRQEDVAYDESNPPSETWDSVRGDADKASPRSFSRGLRRAIEHLPAEDREMLRFYADYRGEDWQAAYAHETGMNRNTLRVRYARTLRKLKALLQGQAGGSLEALAGGNPGEPEGAVADGVSAEFERPVEGFWVGRTYRLNVDVGRLASGIRAAEEEGRPENLLVVVAGEDVEVEPDSRTVPLDAAESASPLTFDVRFVRGGTVILIISVFAPPEMNLLRKLEVTMPPVKYEVEPRRRPARD